ncbi:MAG: hypothetical protein II077_09725, partial [Treponema sp.]|nr:hypothetical protein [Treponema sp.]
MFNMEYKIKVNVSEEDYKKFNYDFYYHKIGTVIRLVIVFLMIAVVAVCSFLSFRLTGKISEFLPLIIILLAYVF